MEIPGIIGGKASHTEGFNDHGIIVVGKVGENSCFQGGDQLQECDFLIQPVIKPDGVCQQCFIIQIKDHLLVLNRGNIREVDAGEGIIAFGAFLFAPGAGDHLAVKNDGNSIGFIMGGKAQAVG